MTEKSPNPPSFVHPVKKDDVESSEIGNVEDINDQYPPVRTLAGVMLALYLCMFLVALVSLL